MAKQCHNGLVLLFLVTIFTLSNASITFPGASFFSGGLFGSKATEAPAIDPLPAASSPGGQFTTVEFGTGTSNSQSGGSQSGGQQPGSSNQQPSPSTSGSQFGYGNASPSSPTAQVPQTQFKGSQSQPQHQTPPNSNSRPQLSPNLQALYSGSSPNHGGSQPQSPPPNNHGGHQSSPPSYTGPHLPPPNYGGSQPTHGGSQASPSYGGHQSYGGPSPQKAQDQNNFYSRPKIPQSNSAGLPPYNPNLSPPVATYSSGLLPIYSGNSQSYLNSQNPNTNVQFNQFKQSSFVTNAYDIVKVKDEGQWTPDNQFGAEDAAGSNNKGRNTSKKGAFSWTSPEGELYEVSYVADALYRNSRPQGNFIRSPQQIIEVNPPSRTHETLNPYGLGPPTSFDQLGTFSNSVQNFPSASSSYNPTPSTSHKPHSRFPIF